MTTLVLEDGSIVTGANTYILASTLTDFATARGITLAADPTMLIVEAMDYIEALGYKGLKRSRAQYLQWPRAYVYIDGYFTDVTIIPQQLKDGLCFVAMAIDAGNSPLLTITRVATSEKVGDLSVHYVKDAPFNTIDPKIHNALYKILANGGSGGLSVGKA